MSVVAGGWGRWSGWGQCRVTCGQGEQSRYRQCKHPPQSNVVASCMGNRTDTQTCVNQPCPGTYVTYLAHVAMPLPIVSFFVKTCIYTYIAIQNIQYIYIHVTNNYY